MSIAFLSILRYNSPKRMEVSTTKTLTHIEHGKFALIEAGKIDATPLITHWFKLEEIEEAYHIFENKLDGVIKIAVEPNRKENQYERIDY